MLDDHGILRPISRATIRIDHGALSARGEAYAMMHAQDHDFIAHDWQVRGTVTPGMASTDDAVLCFRFDAAELTLARYDFDETYTLLDVLVSRGIVFGVPGVEGMQPDLDMDRDELEVFVADEDGRISACIDGDGTIIESTEEEHCATREEMPDSYRGVLEFQGGQAFLILCPDDCCSRADD